MYARLLLFAATLTLSCAAQSVISAKSGTLHYFTGQVSIDGVDKQMKPGVFPMVKPESILRTEVGQAEVLLTPGVFLRVNYHSAMQTLLHVIVMNNLVNFLVYSVSEVSAKTMLMCFAVWYSLS